MEDSHALDVNQSLYRIVRLLRLVENRRCADCSRALGDGSSAYAQLQFHVWICQDCAKIHVRYVNSDTLMAAMAGSWNEDDINAMVGAGSNVQQNKILEHCPNGITKPSPDSTDAVREIWIRCKYSRLLMMPMGTSPSIPPSKPPKPARLSRGNYRQSIGKSTMGLVMEQAIEEGFKTNLPTRFADFFINIGPKPLTEAELEAAKKDGKMPSHCEDILFKPTIEGCFPRPNTYEDAPVPDMAAPFIFTDGMHLSPKDVPPKVFSFVLTDEHRVKIYGTALVFYELQEPHQIDALLGKEKEKSQHWALVYAPKAIAVIGHYPFFHAYSEFLKDLFHASLSSGPVPIERLVQYFMIQTPLPPLGKVEVRLQLCSQTMLLSRPPLNKLPMVDFSYRPLFACLSVQNIILVFRIICAEFSVCFVSKNTSLLTPVQESVLSLLFPMVWQGVYIPILPRSMLDILDAPVPIVMGVDKAFIQHIPVNNRPKSLIFVDLDTNEVHIGPSLLNDVTGSELSTLCAEAQEGALDGFIDMEARQEILSFLMEPIPQRQVVKLTAALEKYGGCIYDHNVANQLLLVAGKPYPNDEHLTPLVSFAVEEGTVVSSGNRQREKDLKSSTYAATKTLGSTAQRAKDRLVGGDSSLSNLSMSSSYRSILDPCNNTHNVLCTKWDDCDNFDAEEIREAFLRFFVSLFLENDDYYINVGKRRDSSRGDMRASVLGGAKRPNSSKMSSPGGETPTVRRRSRAINVMKYFTTTSPAGNLPVAASGEAQGLDEQGKEFFYSKLSATQMFSQFRDERENLPDLPEIRFFKEKVFEKQNRSKIRWNKDSTPFLADSSDDVSGMYSPPVPSLRGLATGKRFEYARFPALNEANLGTIQPTKVLVEGREMRRKLQRDKDTALSRFVANNAQRLGNTEALQKFKPNPNVKFPQSNPNAKGAAEYRFDDILLQGRVRFAKVTKALAKVQALIRIKKLRRCYLTAKAAVRLIQRVYRGYVGYKAAVGVRLLRQAITNEHHIVSLQACVRMFVKQSMYLRFRIRVVLIQSLFRMTKVRAQYVVTIGRVRLIKAIICGWIYRRKVKRERRVLMDRYGTHLLLAWNVWHTSFFHRSLFWTMVKDSTFLNLALLKAELLRMYNLLGFTVAAQAAGGGHTKLLDEVPRSATFKTILKARGVTTGSDDVAKALGEKFLQSHSDRAAKLKGEMDAVYRAFKYDVSSDAKEVLFARFGIPMEAKRRKETLMAALWSDPTSLQNASDSVRALRIARDEADKGTGDGDGTLSFLFRGRSSAGDDSTIGALEEEWCKRTKAERLSAASLETVRACLWLISQQKNVIRQGSERRVRLPPPGTRNEKRSEKGHKLS